MTKVAIIGCSCAGLGTALNLLKMDKSIDVTLYDRKSYVGERTICGGLVSAFALRDLKIQVPGQVIASAIKNVRLYSPNGGYWQLDSEGVYGYVLWRDRFERLLAREVLNLGGKIKLEHEVRSLNLDADVIIGADGLTGVTSKLVGFPHLNDVDLAVQRTAYIDNGDRNRMELYFGENIAPSGYAWVFPLRRHLVRVGLGIPLSLRMNPNRLLDKFMEMVKAEPTSKSNVKLLPTAKPPAKLVYRNILLVGDAAHLCDPMTGGGITNAFQSAEYAVKAIIDHDLERYDYYCRGLKRRNRLRYALKKFLFKLSDEDFNRLISAMKGFKPNLTRISWSLMQAVLTLAVKDPKLLREHGVLRRLSKTLFIKSEK